MSADLTPARLAALGAREARGAPMTAPLKPNIISAENIAWARNRASLKDDLRLEVIDWRYILDSHEALRAALAAEREAPTTHESGCPAIADDESDQVLSDYGQCVCTRADKWRERAAQIDAELTKEREARETAERCDMLVCPYEKQANELRATVERLEAENMAFRRSLEMLAKGGDS